jgi:hypothetical protein
MNSGKYDIFQMFYKPNSNAIIAGLPGAQQWNRVGKQKIRASGGSGQGVVSAGMSQLLIGGIPQVNAEEHRKWCPAMAHRTRTARNPCSCRLA